MVSLLLQSACILGLRKKLTEDGENDHEEEEKHEDIHEGWQGLKHLTQVSGERDRARRVRDGGWRAGAQGAWSGAAQCGLPLLRWGPGAPNPWNTKSRCTLTCDVMLSDLLGLPLRG